jgi:hypothetical protein
VIIGLSGYARSGKDTFADYLVEEYGFTRIAFADKLREFLLALNPIITSPVWGEHRRLTDVINEFGWNGYKESKYGKEIRELMQRLGTECGRQLISDTVWIDAALRGVSGNVVVTDVRFPNEASAIEDTYDGRVLRVNRPGVGPANDHPSETSLDNHDFYDVFENDGTIDDLRNKIDEFMDEHTWEAKLGSADLDYI